jgi:3-oxoacyl-[acyl-carrier protein] reductase
MTDETFEQAAGDESPVALVTGGARGIGAACCRALAGAGFTVGLIYRGGRQAAEKVSAEFSSSGRGGALLLQADISEPSAIDAMLKQVKAEAGRVDVLVNNAGISVNEAMMTMSIDAFDAQRAALRGAWYLTKRVIRMFMLRRGTGRIINISSVVGHTGNPGQIPYTMEKAGMDAMTKSLARELAGREILVNSVAPGFIDTDMTGALSGEIRQAILATVPLGRMGRPEEVAEVVRFLATGGSYIQGSVIHVNGGMYGG